MTCAVCPEFDPTDPRWGEHPADWEITTATGDVFLVCDARLAETEAGFAEYDAPIQSKRPIVETPTAQCASCLDEAEWGGVDPETSDATGTDDDGRPACDFHREPGAMFRA